MEILSVLEFRTDSNDFASYVSFKKKQFEWIFENIKKKAASCIERSHSRLANTTKCIEWRMNPF